MSRIMIFPIETVVTVMATVETILPIIEYLATPVAGPIAVMVEDIILSGVPALSYSDLPVEIMTPAGEEFAANDIAMAPYMPYLIPYEPLLNHEQRVASVTIMPDRPDYFNG